MDKITIEYTEREDAMDALRANEYKCKLDDIWTRCFRPARKNGYQEKAISGLLDRLGEDGYELIDQVGQLYLEVVNEDCL